jgi:hypothetical protein
MKGFMVRLKAVLRVDCMMRRLRSATTWNLRGWVVGGHTGQGKWSVVLHTGQAVFAASLLHAVWANSVCCLLRPHLFS